MLRPHAVLPVLALALFLAGRGAAAADEVPGESPHDRVHLRNGRIFEGRITDEDARQIVLELRSDTGGRGCIRIPREMVCRVERGIDRPPPRPAGSVRDQWYLLTSGSHVLGARHLVLKRVRSESVDGWRLEEAIEHFARGPEIPAVRIQRTERTDLAFHPVQMHYREVGEASPVRDGPPRYERILTGNVRDGLWEVLVHVGGEAEQRRVPLPPGLRGRLGAREHVLRQRELGLRTIQFLDAASGEPVTVRAGYTELDARDAAGRRYDEFVWEEAGERRLSRFQSSEVIEEAVTERVVAVPVREAQVAAARREGASRGGEGGAVQLAALGVAFRLPDASWRYAGVESPPAALGWRKVGVVENARLVADVRVEWDPEGAAMTPGGEEAAERLLQRLRAWCPDLRVVRPRQALSPAREAAEGAWRMDFTGTLRGERVRTVAVVLDQGQGRVLFLAACPEVSWPEAAIGIERLVASIERL